jgi:hypothetical protein
VRKLFGAITVFIYFLIGKVFPGLVVKRLFNALSSPNEEVSMMAYMALCKVGRKHAAQIAKWVDKRGPTPGTVQLLADLGDLSVLPQLESYVNSEDPEIVEATKTALATKV